MSEGKSEITPHQTGWVTNWLWGPYSGFVLCLSALFLVLDQGTKLWLLHGFKLAEKGSVPVLPFFDLVLVWNRGISYGLFQQDSDFGRLALLAVTTLASVALWVWSVRSDRYFLALALAFVIGGALGNGLDRYLYGAVVDFAHFHVGTFSWYVFNLADVWIVAGVAGLLYDGLQSGPNSAAK